MLKRDNGWFIGMYGNNGAWVHVDFDGMRHYMPMNRKARRCFESKKFRNRGKQFKIIFDDKEGMLV